MEKLELTCNLCLFGLKTGFVFSRRIGDGLVGNELVVTSGDAQAGTRLLLAQPLLT